jgi:choline kinase
MTTKEQHIEDTKYLQWADGMYVMLEDLQDDYELAVIENSLRDSVWYKKGGAFLLSVSIFDQLIGVGLEDPMYMSDNCVSQLKIKLTRAQALYISTGAHRVMIEFNTPEDLHTITRYYKQESAKQNEHCDVYIINIHELCEKWEHLFKFAANTILARIQRDSKP